MPEKPIHFFCEEITFNLPNPRRTSKWIKEVILKEKKKPGSLNYIFCSDEYLLKINQQYLSHNTYTDIITFNGSEDPETISGDIFISIERVEENCNTLKTSFEEELHRVIIHGVLHLIGYKDKSNRQKSLMRKKEDAYLSLR